MLVVALIALAALQDHVIVQNTPDFLADTVTFTQVAYDGICKKNGTYYRSFSSQPTPCHNVPVNVTFTIQRHSTF